ncbi:MAG: transposase [Deltaproteobacteria bacterium]
MPRAKLFRTSSFCYHVTTRSNNREWFYLPMEISWKIFCYSANEAAERYGVNLHSFLLMSNHFHLLCGTPRENLDEFMRYFLSNATKRMQRQANRINHILGARYRGTVIESAWALAYVFKYIYRNPIRAGISDKVEDYPWSSVQKQNDLVLSEGIDSYWGSIPKDPSDRLLWLNKATSKENELLIGRALRRSKFKFTTDSNFQARLRELEKSYGISRYL